MGPTPPGPLEWAEADIIDTTTGDSVASTGGLVPLDGQAPSGVPTYF